MYLPLMRTTNNQKLRSHKLLANEGQPSGIFLNASQLSLSRVHEG